MGLMYKICIFAKKVVILQRIMDWCLLLYRAKSWLKFHLTAWNTGGEGVHSPYLFEWVSMVMSDKHSYYGWSAIEDCRRSMLQDERVLEFVDFGRGSLSSRAVCQSSSRVCDIAKGSLTRRSYAQMLSRLVHWLGGQLREGDKGLKIVELGTSLGLTTAYLAKPDSRNMVLTYEGCEAVAAVARENWKALGVNNIRCHVGKIEVETLDKELDVVDVAFVDANHTYAGAREYFNVLARKVHAKSVIVMDDIHHNEEMERVWKEICEDDRVTSTMDLYQMGLVFFDPHYWRRNYRMRLK